MKIRRKIFSEKKEDKNKAEKLGKTIAKVGAAGTVVGAVTPTIAAGAHPFKETLKAIPGATKLAIKEKIKGKLNAKELKKVNKIFETADKESRSMADNKAAERYIRRATKIATKKTARNLGVGLGVTGAGLALGAAGKLVRKKKEGKK